MNYNFSFSKDFLGGLDLSQLQYEITQVIFSAICLGGSQLEDAVILYFDQALSTDDEAGLSVIISLHVPNGVYNYMLAVDGSISISSSKNDIEAISVFNQNLEGGMKISAGIAGCSLDSLGCLDIMSNGLEMTAPYICVSSDIFYNRSKTLHTTATPIGIAANESSLSVAQITNGIVFTTSSAAAANKVSLPIASLLITVLTTAFVDIIPRDSWEFSFINTCSTDWDIFASEGNSLTGSGHVAAKSSARFKVRIMDIDVPAYGVYRLA